MKTKYIIILIALVGVFSFSMPSDSYAAVEYDLDSINWSVFHQDIKTQFTKCITTDYYAPDCIESAPNFLGSITTQDEEDELKKYVYWIWELFIPLKNATIILII